MCSDIVSQYNALVKPDMIMDISDIFLKFYGKVHISLQVKNASFDQLEEIIDTNFELLEYKQSFDELEATEEQMKNRVQVLACYNWIKEQVKDGGETAVMGLK